MIVHQVHEKEPVTINNSLIQDYYPRVPIEKYLVQSTLSALRPLS